jgi:hypothetical protein
VPDENAFGPRFFNCARSALEKDCQRAEILMSAHCPLSPATTLAFISRLLGRVLANTSLALVRDRLANVFSQIVPFFAAILTVVPGT